MARKRLRLKIRQLKEALEEHQLNDHHPWLIDQSVEHAKFVDQQVEELEDILPAFTGYPRYFTLC
jgi:hypothetical protein